jgi:hypothetical protein
VVAALVGVDARRKSIRFGSRWRIRIDKQTPTGWFARSHAAAPEINGTVKIEGEAQPGEFATVLVTGLRRMI